MSDKYVVEGWSLFKIISSWERIWKKGKCLDMSDKHDLWSKVITPSK